MTWDYSRPILLAGRWFRQEDGVSLLSVRSEDGSSFLSGEFDMAATEEFAAGTETALDAKRPVVLDLSELTFLDSSGLHTIAQLASWCVPGGLILRNSPCIAKVIHLLRLEREPGIRLERQAV